MAKGQCNEKMTIYYPKSRDTTPQFSEARIIDPKVGNISLLATLGSFFEQKNGLLGKQKHFSAKRINGRFSVIPAGTTSFVIVGHFLWPRQSHQVW